MKFITKSYLYNIFKENRIFTLFSFLSCIMPITYCLLASLIQPNGSQAVMAVGYVMPFILAFMQLSFTVSMIIFAKLKEINSKRLQQNDHLIISATIWMSIIIGLICAIFYVASTASYMYFSNNRPNTQEMLYYGLDFTWITIPFVLLFPIYISLIFTIRRKRKSMALVFVLTFFMITTLLSFLFSYFTNLKVMGLGLGLTIGVLISIIINVAYAKRYYLLLVYSPIYLNEFVKHIHKIIFKESITSISLSLFKGIAIIFLSITIPDTINNFVPLSYQMSRVVWFNMMYFIPFIGIGVGEGIRFHYLSHHGVYDDEDVCYLEHRWRNDFKVIFLVLFLTIGVGVGSFFLIEPLNVVYSINDKNTFSNTMPVIEGWGTPSLSLTPTEMIDFQKLSQIKLDKLPEFQKPNGNPAHDQMIQIINLKLFTDWLNVQIKNNQEILGPMSTTLNDWYKWLNQTNESGQTIIQFINEKYNIVVFDEIIKIIKGEKPNEGFLNAVQGGLKYFVYLWLYSNTSNIVTDSFLLLRPFINFNNVLSNIGPNYSIIDALANNSLESVLTSLFLTTNSFSANAMIYVGVYGILNSIWAILLQLNQRNYKKGMPYWLLSLIYAICVGSLVAFGVLFSVTLKDILGSHNPFMYLDAWTFPLIVIAFIVIVVLSIKCYISYKMLRDERRRRKINNAMRFH